MSNKDITLHCIYMYILRTRSSISASAAYRRRYWYIFILNLTYSSYTAKTPARKTSRTLIARVPFFRLYVIRIYFEAMGFDINEIIQNSAKLVNFINLSISYILCNLLQTITKEATENINVRNCLQICYIDKYRLATGVDFYLGQET